MGRIARALPPIPPQNLPRLDLLPHHRDSLPKIFLGWPRSSLPSGLKETLCDIWGSSYVYLLDLNFGSKKKPARPQGPAAATNLNPARKPPPMPTVPRKKPASPRASCRLRVDALASISSATAAAVPGAASLLEAA
ncbi:hypothetical protein BRADI_3g15033v3 [Brachypodium distachyon]|uniref:Uncharacterized protein n=1 Tax=Brachypodium distachyon TaxID=15368 RepID=A0A0Q3F9Y5_BRADI|nr:hypothetical protein BRADI_3g15033v3 [Brachypodium distachyon]